MDNLEIGTRLHCCCRPITKNTTKKNQKKPKTKPAKRMSLPTNLLALSPADALNREQQDGDGERKVLTMRRATVMYVFYNEEPETSILPKEVLKQGDKREA
jgi:hypothetical protein